MATPQQPDIAAAAVANLTAHAGWVQNRCAGMRVRETDDYVLIDSGLPCDTFNFVCRARLEAKTAAQRIQAALNYFTAVRRPFAWWLSPGDQPADLADLLQAAGLQEAETEEAMVADLSQLAEADLAPQGLRIRRVRTASGIQDFGRVVAANWNPPDLDVLRFYDMATPVLLDRAAALWLYVGYVDDNPVASAELAVGGGVVGLYNICTRVDYRRRGFGTALTLQPLLDARAQGHRRAILQASRQGAPIYRHLGFETFGQITEYKPPAD